MNLHLSTNFMLREIFELPPPLPAMDPTNASKMSKTERVSSNIFDLFETYYFSHLNFQNAANQLAFKLRTQTRNKNRDKRSAVV